MGMFEATMQAFIEEGLGGIYIETYENSTFLNIPQMDSTTNVADLVRKTW